MNKSILVIDTPSSCKMCPLSYFNEMYNEHMCQGTLGKNTYARTIGIYSGDRPEWCPLSPIPEKKKLRQYADNTALNMESMLAYQYAQGWNDCADELMEGNE